MQEDPSHLVMLSCIIEWLCVSFGCHLSELPPPVHPKDARGCAQIFYPSPPQRRSEVWRKPFKVSHENLDITNPAAVLLPNKATFLLTDPQPIRLRLEKLNQLELRQAVDVKLNLCRGK